MTQLCCCLLPFLLLIPAHHHKLAKKNYMLFFALVSYSVCLWSVTKACHINTTTVMCAHLRHVHRGAVASLREQASSKDAPAWVDVTYWSLCSPHAKGPTILPITATTPRAAPPVSDGPMMGGAGRPADEMEIQGQGAEAVGDIKQGMGPVSGGFPSPPILARIHKPEEEIAYGPACWLWDYLR